MGRTRGLWWDDVVPGLAAAVITWWRDLPERWQDAVITMSSVGIGVVAYALGCPRCSGPGSPHRTGCGSRCYGTPSPA